MTQVTVSAVFSGVIWDRLFYSHPPSLDWAECGDQCGLKLLITSGHMIGHGMWVRDGSYGIAVNCGRDQTLLLCFLKCVNDNWDI